MIDLGEIVVGNLPDDHIESAQILFGLAPPVPQKFARFATEVAAKALGGILANRAERWADFDVAVREYGEPVEGACVSVIVPLYGRIDFVEHQLLEFSRDPFFRANVDLIYVLDDPRLVDRFFEQAPLLYEIYSVPFRAVWGNANRGFSGANNLGASIAKAEKLLFLNSDVFPQHSGWLESLLAVLEDERVGAVAPRLVFADGSIQHAGMSFRRRGDLEIWVNHHPNMGLDPELDPSGQALTAMPALTGACLAMRGRDFHAVGGWDTGYLVGDFEDSDLCLKLRSMGKLVMYQPRVQLTHLERQSFALLGESDFRFRVVIFNASRHQSRWQSLLEGEPSV
ncbi:glycosyltransferase family 2 protein [Brachybacterium sp. J153]|uniref:glycosyltransferase family 2 protein n=1 Tax=Brachybacterium sp. J153 TaxID=3116488 RepID=UPI002E789D9E|nr:glycosyltransferase family 2 protein [Brachybacterium sp. J153]MEE1617831.1 glycosyltransferase family 2 protein [Brachybacterium sp. J153]